MTTLQIEQKPTTPTQNVTLLDHLHCEESYRNENDVIDYNVDNDFRSFDDENDHFLALLSKEEKTCVSKNIALECSKFFLMEVREEMLEWMKCVSSYHNLSMVTLVLAMNYFDRFIISVGFQREKPWLTQLVALACISLASKFEEVHVPHIFDLQVFCKYMFEAKTIKRMELLILSTLEWNMNAVTPVSYFGHLIRMFKLNSSHLRWEILSKWERLILSAIADPRYLHYVPSILATATMLETLKELGLGKTTQHEIHFIDTFKLNKDKVEECSKFIQEISSDNKRHKRNYSSSGDSSPTRVLDLVLSETSQESPDQNVPKKCRTLESHC